MFRQLGRGGRVGRANGPGLRPLHLLGSTSCRAAMASVFPVIELHHHVLHSPQPSLAELVATGGMHAGFVGAKVERAAGLADLESFSLWLDDQRMGTVAASDLTGMVVQSLNWLAFRLADAGLALVKGQIVLTGSLLNLYAVGPKRRVIADVSADWTQFGRDRPLKRLCASDGEYAAGQYDLASSGPYVRQYGCKCSKTSSRGDRRGLTTDGIRQRNDRTVVARRPIPPCQPYAQGCETRRWCDAFRPPASSRSKGALALHRRPQRPR